MRTIKEFRYRKDGDGRTNQEFKSADPYGNVRLGTEHLFWKRGLFWYYAGFEELIRVYRRIEAVDTKTCCANVNFDIQKLVLVFADGTELEVRIGDGMPREAQQVYEQMKVRAPGIAFGKNQKCASAEHGIGKN